LTGDSFDRAMQAALDGAFGDAQLRGRGGDVLLLFVHQPEDLPLGLGQLVDGPAEAFEHLRPLQQVGGVEGGLVLQPVRLAGLGVRPSRQGPLRAAALASQVVQRQVDRDPPQPTRDGAAARPLVRPLPQPQEYLLEQIVRPVIVADDRGKPPPDGPGVPGHQGVERGRVPVADPPHQDLIGFGPRHAIPPQGHRRPGRSSFRQVQSSPIFSAMPSRPAGIFRVGCRTGCTTQVGMLFVPPEGRQSGSPGRKAWVWRARISLFQPRRGGRGARSVAPRGLQKEERGRSESQASRPGLQFSRPPG